LTANLSPAVPKHVAIIMDGNGRWAKSRGLPRLEGHRRGADVAQDVVRWAADAGVQQISLYAFSTENWERPHDEVTGLMTLLATMLTMQVPAMKKEGVRLRVLGDISALPRLAHQAVQHALRATAQGERIELVLCLNYGGQQEILAGARRLAHSYHAGELSEAALDSMTPADFRQLLWRDELLPVDLLIRTGGEYRISNFHLWDAAYAELYFSPEFWPDYNREAFHQALAGYQCRERRFGLISEQLNAESTATHE
jgi:undecaprenyl diphosphate synthase